MQNLETRIINTLDTIEQINAGSNLDGIFETLTDYGLSLGFSTISMTPIINPAVLNIDITTVGRSTWPDEFLQTWINKNYVIHDPVSRRALTHHDIVSWKDAYETASPKARNILDEGAEYGLAEGITVPVHLPHLPPGAVAFSSDRCDFSPEEMAEIQLIATHAYSRFMRVSKFKDIAQISTLTERECEILHYVAAGKTNRQIANLFALSEYSIKDHMKNISLKLKASNRAHAVSLGILSGQIMI